MYKTIKLRLKLTLQQKQLFKSYEEIFHESLTMLVVNMRKDKPSYPVSEFAISNAVHTKSKWNLYKEGKALHAYDLRHKQWEFHKSSIWNPLSVLLEERKIIFLFGDLFLKKRTKVVVACEKEEWELLKLGKIIRIDLVHDEMYWFANFILHVSMS